MYKKVIYTIEGFGEGFKEIEKKMGEYMERIDNVPISTVGIRKYDNIDDAFIVEHTHDKLMEYDNERLCTKLLNKRLGFSDVANFITHNIKHEDSDCISAILDDKIDSELEYVYDILNDENGVDKFREIYELKEDAFGDSFVIFK